MSRAKTPDTLGWFAALITAADEARRLRTGPTLGPAARCLCGSDDTRGRILAKPVNLTEGDVTVVRNSGQRDCQGCRHGIHHGAMCVQRHYSATTTVRDTFHPTCVEI